MIMVNTSLPGPEAIGATKTATLNAALKSASHQHGVSFDYLFATAKRESSLNPLAQAKTSSAAGLFQFIEQTWLAAVKTYGDQHGLSDAANTISKDATGRYSISDPEKRQAILDLRYDPEKAAGLAAALTADNRDRLQTKLGRSITDSHLYAAHFLGLGGASRLLSAKPDELGTTLFPKAAKANPAIFFDNGRPKTVAQILAGFETTFGKTGEQSSGGQKNSVTPAIDIKQTIPERVRPLASSLQSRVLAQANVHRLNFVSAQEYPPVRTPVSIDTQQETSFLSSFTPPTPSGLSALELVALAALDPTILANPDDEALEGEKARS